MWRPELSDTLIQNCFISANIIPYMADNFEENFINSYFLIDISVTLKYSWSFPRKSFKSKASIIF